MKNVAFHLSTNEWRKDPRENSELIHLIGFSLNWLIDHRMSSDWNEPILRKIPSNPNGIRKEIEHIDSIGIHHCWSITENHSRWLFLLWTSEYDRIRFYSIVWRNSWKSSPQYFRFGGEINPMIFTIHRTFSSDSSSFICLFTTTFFRFEKYFRWNWVKRNRWKTLFSWSLCFVSWRISALLYGQSNSSRHVVGHVSDHSLSFQWETKKPTFA